MKLLIRAKNSQTTLSHGHIFTIKLRKSELSQLISIKENILRPDSFKPYRRHSNPSYLSDQPKIHDTIFLPANPAFQAIWCSLCIVKIV